MHCPACHTVYGGPTMAAFACCPRCLAEDQRVELLIHSDDEPPGIAEPFDAPITTDDGVLGPRLD
jgi:hypothetical protein